MRRSVREPHYDAEIHVVGTVRLLRTRVSAESYVRHGVRKLVFVSSVAQSTANSKRCSPPDNPQTPQYGLAGSRNWPESVYLLLYWLRRGIKYVALCRSNVYGLRQGPHVEAGGGGHLSTNLAGVAGRIPTTDAVWET